MVNNNNELLIAKSLGWLGEDEKDIFQDSSMENTENFLTSIKDNNFFLTIISDNGRIYQQSLPVRISRDEILIKKPDGWENKFKSFHVFFPKIDNKWNFFSANVKGHSSDILTINIPGKVYFLQKRGHRRFPVPPGTKAFFKENGAMDIDIVQVQDISAGGMLICQRPSGDKYSIDSLINQIFIMIPPIIENGEISSSKKISPLITQGKIVHSFFNQETSLACYGISFLYQSSYIKKIVTDFVDELAI